MSSISEFIINQKLNDQRELVFFGGSFNPWHDGHSECVRLLNQEKTLIIVPDHSPHKELTLKENKLSKIDDIKDNLKPLNKDFYLFKGFLELNEKNPTINWIKELNTNFPTTKLSLLIGFDTFKTIMTWNDSTELLTLLDTLYIVSRMEDAKEQQQISIDIHKVIPKIKLKFLGHHPYEHLSSTNIREDVI